MSYSVVTITREFGSGGRTIAKKLAEELGYDYYDYELVQKIALDDNELEQVLKKEAKKDEKQQEGQKTEE